MAKSWDNSGIAFRKDTWEKCFQVLKPGGYLLAFGGTRTYHRIVCAIEDAGFEIRDTIMWLYGSGFPKSMNLGKAIESKILNGSANTQDFHKLKGEMVKTGDWGMGKLTKEQGYRPADYWEDEHLRVATVEYQTEEGKQWDGWGTALKPAYEPVVIARKPCVGSCVDNVLKYGVGGINIDECRVPYNGEDNWGTQKSGNTAKAFNLNDQQREAGTGVLAGYECSANDGGRFPSNVILTYDDSDFNEVCGGMPFTESNGGATTMPDFRDAGQKNSYNKIGFNDGGTADRKESIYVAPKDSGSAARYFYCAKASNKDRDEGLDEFEEQITKITNQYEMVRNDGTMREVPTKKNIHPTVKPCELMQYLIRLVTPKDGVILDPFNGSGSTGKAAMYENREREANYKYIGIDVSADYLSISEARISHVANKPVQYKLF